MNNPNTMAARIFKAKYYSNGKFMDGAIRHNPSFSWRSIDNSRVLLKEGSRSLFDFIPRSEELTVKSLLCDGNKVWNATMVHMIFSERDARKASMWMGIWNLKVPPSLLRYPSYSFQTSKERFLVDRLKTFYTNSSENGSIILQCNNLLVQNPTYCVC
ncbi:hypothetical protein JHK82_054179 [Glycine max]|uniref:Uncharacterized protein n=2 Tax=Glycine subgen. Soja TaxID=1462606 RepID=A0A0R0ERC7_SOYBN|nr:hypothetical protein JHK86_054026 [Glycine max]KAG4916529.1 hypothetical protein JHK87_054086 [Glycine soja]KAG4928496.1 hypothetical protein JHK85_054982 [Glycine max]KAG5084013.1 hypothetical protein JHK84_054051 [Glycine max]KAG5086782.1 hypothetical protein JHK82_054179 [Glycine max]